MPAACSFSGRGHVRSSDVVFIQEWSLPTRRAIYSAWTTASFSGPKSHHRSLTTTSSPEISPLSRKDQPVRILYASQGGTAMLFSQELEEALGDELGKECTILSWKEAGENSPQEVLTPGEALHVFLTSVSGVGEPPDNGREFFQWIMEQEPVGGGGVSWNEVEYTVFGLGNSKAHPNHYNVIGKALDAKLKALGAQRVLELGLGDDGDCIEDDFDKFLENLLQLLRDAEEGESPPEAELEPADEQTVVQSHSQDAKKDDSSSPRVSCPPGVSSREDGTRLASTKRPTIKLLTPVTDIVRENLFHLQGTPNQFYPSSVKEWEVNSNQSLAPQGGDTALHEMKIRIVPGQKLEYETGDHLKIYPRNSQVIVDAYLERLEVNRHSIVADEDQTADNYPHPKGLTINETLTHCVDLGATPSPSFARFLLGRKDIDYRTDIALARRTVIDLLGEQGPEKKIALEDLLYELPPMKPRYYSIASSSLMRPDEIVLVFRPCKYVSSRGILREGVCTSYMLHQAAAAVGSVVDNTTTSSIPAVVNSNPGFRLPEDPSSPILMIAGGCGIAPIRAFIEERSAMRSSNLGPCKLFLGFRSPEDEAYQPLIQKALATGALTDAKITYSYGCREPHQVCMLVSEMIRIQGKEVWDHFENGGYTYMCGGARTFGAAVEAEMIDVLQQHGDMSWDEAQTYLRSLAQSGRLLEDLAD